jgi:hypothetical protein
MTGSAERHRPLLSGGRVPPTDALYEYALAVDEVDEVRFRRSFETYAVVVARIPGESEARWEGCDEIVRNILGGRRGPVSETRRHLITNVQVLEDTGDEASIQAYHLVMGTANGIPVPRATGRYGAYMRRGRDGRWRIAHLVVDLDSDHRPPGLPN